MSCENNRTTLSIGVLFLTIVVALLLYAGGLIGWALIIPMILLLLGLWILVLAALRMGKPIKYALSGFSTVALGFITIAVGGAWFVFGVNWLYSVIVILLVIAAIAIASAIQHK